MNKIFEKVIAMMLVIILTGANLIFLGEYATVYALSDDEINKQKTSTNNKNIEFNSYFDDGTHIKAFNMDSNEAKIYLNIKVKNAGYLKNGTIEFINANFELKDEISNEKIQSIENNKIILNKLDNGSDITIEVPIKILKKEEIENDFFNKETITKLTGTYINENGKETSIEKEVINKLSWIGKAEAELKSEITKYIPFSNNQDTGLMLQAKVISNIKDSSLPIKNTKLQILVPTINNVKPTSVVVISTKTEATNGKSDGIEFSNNNYSYDVENGIITINTKNNDEKISWKKNTADEYLITFLFEGEEIYNYIKKNGIDTKVEINSEINVFNNSEFTVKASNILNIKYTSENEKIGNIIDYDLISQDINKGQIYANYDAKEKYEVEYNTKYIITINSAKLTKDINLIQDYDQFVTKDGAIGSTTINENNYTYNKKVQVSQDIFNKILGEDGNIIVENEKGIELGKINKDTNLEDGLYTLDISEKNNNKLKIITTQPISEGQLEINIIKALKTDIGYSKQQMNSFNKIKLQMIGDINSEKINIEKTINLKEPINKAEISIEPKNLSTIVKNENVEIRVVLDTSIDNYALYKNPTLEIEMPKDITKVDLKSIDLLLDEELKIKSSEVINKNDKQVIRITIEGMQTKYNRSQTETTISKGANIVIKADITLDKFTTNKTEEVTLNYKNENSDVYENNIQTMSTETIGQVSTEVKLVAPSGVTTTNSISEYDDKGSSIIAISDEKQEATIPVHSNSRQMKIGGIIINNYSNDISNIVILGRFMVKDNINVETGENLGSNFNIPLSEKISIVGTDNATIYYSDNANATKDLALESNGWTNNPNNLSNMKSYMIVLNNNMKASDKIEFYYKATVPENLEYGNSTYEMYKVFYTNNSEEAVINETKVSPIIGLTTGQGPEIKLSMTSNVKQEDGKNIIRQGSMVRIWATLENTGKLDAKDVKLTIVKPEELELLQYDDSYLGYNQLENNEIEVGTIKAGESTTVSFEIQLNKDFAINKDDLEGNVEMKVSASNMAYTVSSDKLTLTYKVGLLTIKNIPNVRENYLYTAGNNIEYDITIVNNTEALTDFTLTIPLPGDLQNIEAYWLNGKDNQDKEGIQIASDKIIATKSLLESGNNKFVVKFKLGINTETRFSTQVYAEGSYNIEGTLEKTGICYSNERFINKGEPELTGKQLELENAYIKEGKEFSYKFEIKTAGSGTQNNFIFEDIIPEGLEYVRSNIDVIYPGPEDDESIDISYKDNIIKGTIDRLQPNATINIEIVVKGHLESKSEDEKEITNTATVSTNQIEKFELNPVTVYIEYDETQHGNPEEPDNPEEPTGDNKKITGIAWIDSNKNGRRDSEEKTLSGIQVMLLNKSNNEVVKNSETGKEQIVTTGNDGRYTFNNVEKGEYIVVFIYDASMYNITAYRSGNVEESVNSDAISMKITLNGEQKEVGLTDIIKVSDSNIRNIDIGLYIAEKFDLRLDKYINKITLTTPTIGTQSTNYNNSKLQKVEVLEKNINQSSIVVEYKLVIKNEGKIAGYAKKIVDYLPKNMKFNTELNPDWYISDTTGNVYNATLANTKLEPGESKELSLILSVQITEDNIGKTITNTAEILESYNEKGIPDMDSTAGNKKETEDDMSQAEVVLSIVTGNIIIIYIIVVLVIISILGVGIYEIRKRVLKK